MIADYRDFFFAYRRVLAAADCGNIYVHQAHVTVAYGATSNYSGLRFGELVGDVTTVTRLGPVLVRARHSVLDSLRRTAAVRLYPRGDVIVWREL